MAAEIRFANGAKKDVRLVCRIDTLDELAYFKAGGILQFVLRNLAAA
jgi:aconitate hydratase